MVDENIHKEKPNWLLYFLIAVSVMIHAGFFIQMYGRFNFKPVSYIEVSVRKNVKPQNRQTPKPRKHPAAEAIQNNLPRVLPDYTAPVIEPVPETPDTPKLTESVPALDSAPEDIPDDIAAEDLAFDIAEFSLPDVEDGGGFGSRMDYLDMVRLKIESTKQYPPFSRQRNIEGMVTVEFLIGLDGFISGLKVVASSGFPSLDAAAVSAVNNAAPFSVPPDKYFKQPVRVKVPIAFELIQ